MPGDGGLSAPGISGIPVLPDEQTHFFPAELLDASVQSFHSIDQCELVDLVQAVYPR
jgi:hypothetical protein